MLEVLPSEPSDQVVLPIGIEKDGQRYRNVVIDEFCGVDEALISNKKKTGGNPAKGMTLVLARSIQEIEGLVSRKTSSYGLIDYMIARNMYQIDRDFLFSRMQILADRDNSMYRGTCRRCTKNIEEDVLLSELPIRYLKDEETPEVAFELPAGYVETIQKGEHRGKKRVHKQGVIRYSKGSDQEHVAMIAENNPAQALTALLAACILKLGELPNIDQDIVSKFRSRDRRYLFRMIRDHAPGLKIWKYMYCYNCGFDKVEVTVDFTSFFD
jgi:hypothetical protein